MIYLFPKTRFAETNTTEKQLKHILSEADEVRNSIVNAEPAHRTIEEVVDTWHSIETYIRILEKEHGIERVLEAIDQVVKKNDERGYYQMPTPTIQIDQEDK
jgi:RecA/RadA recombinase